MAPRSCISLRSRSSRSPSRLVSLFTNLRGCSSSISAAAITVAPTGACVRIFGGPRIRRRYSEVVSVAEHPDEPRLQSFTVDDPRLWDVRPQLSFEELALEDVTDEEWDAFYAALAE